MYILWEKQQLLIHWSDTINGFPLDFNMKEIAEEENKWTRRLQILSTNQLENM
jgi:hypothetical protein